MTGTRSPGALCSLLSILYLSLLTVPAVATQDDDGRHLSTARDYLQQKQFKKAVVAFEAAVESGEGDVEEARLGLALAHYRLGNYGKVVQITESLLRLATKETTRVDAYNLLGVSLFNQPDPGTEDLERAEEALREVVSRMGDHPAAIGPMFNLGSVLEKLGRKREALDLFEEILEKDLVEEDATRDRARIAYCHVRGSLGEEPVLEDPGRRERLATVESVRDSVDRSDAESDGVTYVGGKVAAPVKLYTPQPRYPTRAREERVQGTVVAQVIIDRRGCVVSTEVVKSVRPELDTSAADAMSRWVFKPAMLNGHPVDVHYNLTVNFRLR